MSSLRLLLSNSTDPWFNLAVEDCIFRQLAHQRILFLWRNAQTVVIGLGQNPWKECNTGRMQQDGIRLARRSSGGGAVFHDLGNTCFTFMAGKPEYDKSVSTAIILNALNSLGIQVSASGRNDLVAITADGERKISGSAYRETADKGFHHGTLLLNADLSRLADYLNPDPKKLQAKGIASVRSRVANLSELMPNIDHQQLCHAVTQAFFDWYGETTEPEVISADVFPNLPGFSEQFAKQSSWEWNFGKAPAFSHLLNERFSWGGVDIHFDVSQGKISRAQIYTDSLQPDVFSYLAQQLVGKFYRVDDVIRACQECTNCFEQQRDELSELQCWLVGCIK